LCDGFGFLSEKFWGFGVLGMMGFWVFGLQALGVRFGLRV